MVHIMSEEELGELRVLKRDSKGTLWYVRVEPTPSTFLEKAVAWTVRKLTPQWDLIQSVRRIELPLTAEQAGVYLSDRQKTWQHPEHKVALLQIALEGESNE